jgi:TPR repeat protein
MQFNFPEAQRPSIAACFSNAEAVLQLTNHFYVESSVRSTLTLTLALLAAVPVLAQNSYPNTENFGPSVDRHTEWYKECMRVEHVRPPASNSAGLDATCNASEAYYDKLDQAITSPAEWGQVRSCAIASNDTAVLAMLYANGFGVKRDLALATRYASVDAARGRAFRPLRRHHQRHDGGRLRRHRRQAR